jgi:hypothetical protein
MQPYSRPTIAYWMTAPPGLAKPSDPGRAAPDTDRVPVPSFRGHPPIRSPANSQV